MLLISLHGEQKFCRQPDDDWHGLDCRLLEAQRAANDGVWPETIAVVLWGTDNIKTYGESLAQVNIWQAGLGWVSSGIETLHT